MELPMSLIRRKRRYGLYIDCHEKVPQIERMCERVNYGDMMLIIEKIIHRHIHDDPKLVRFGFKFGSGVMGRGAEIRKIMLDTVWEGEEGILVIANFDWRNINCETCYIRNTREKEDVINLGPPDFLHPNIFKGKKLSEVGTSLLGPDGHSQNQQEKK
jgi:hypothetical protein